MEPALPSPDSSPEEHLSPRVYAGGDDGYEAFLETKALVEAYATRNTDHPEYWGETWSGDEEYAEEKAERAKEREKEREKEEKEEAARITVSQCMWRDLPSPMKCALDMPQCDREARAGEVRERRTVAQAKHLVARRLVLARAYETRLRKEAKKIKSEIKHLG
ncbi:hypothetical protein KIPB_006390 [Kipferlia bialata]|uniref:Uncharacterized protein n=1 Tax=Kipferlia bialata TaxID=797122 RepID=A0A391NLU9_9EUKA|nr:hypothetical protein KIPB_006390 [Kipferlia bialata]|eukprot:g6390.t1